MSRKQWRQQAREQLEEVRNLLDSLELELESQGPEWKAAGDMEAIQVREEVAAALELDAAWWESFAPPGERW